MGRDHNKKVHFFQFNAEDNKSKCNVCGVKLAGSHATNLKRHLIPKHEEVFYEFEIDEDKVQQNMKKTRKNAIVEYLDFQIPVTQMKGRKGIGDMQAAKRD